MTRHNDNDSYQTFYHKRPSLEVAPTTLATFWPTMVIFGWLLLIYNSKLRRLRTDLIWCYKIVFGLVRLNFGDFFKYCPVSATRGHPYKLCTSHCTSIRTPFFTHRVIKAWNSLPQSTNFSNEWMNEWMKMNEWNEKWMNENARILSAFENRLRAGFV